MRHTLGSQWKRKKSETELTVKFRQRKCDRAAALHLDQQMTDHVSAGHLSPAAAWWHSMTPLYTHAHTYTRTLPCTLFPPTYPEARASITKALARGPHSLTHTHTRRPPYVTLSHIHACIQTHTRPDTHKMVRLVVNNRGILWTHIRTHEHNMVPCPQAGGLTPYAVPRVFCCATTAPLCLQIQNI